MRQFFVPACLCLMTLSNSTGFDLPLEKMSSSGFDKKTLTRTAGAATDDMADDRATDAAAGDDGIVVNIPQNAPVEVPPVDFSSIDPRDIPLPPVPKPIVPRSREEICQTLSQAAQHNDLPVPFFIRLLFQESRFRPGVVSPAGAQGIAQFMPETSASEGVDNPFDPLQAIPASARLLRKLIAQFGNLGLAAAAYNAGPKRIQDWLEKKGNLPDETQGYVKTVTGRPAETWKVASADGAALTVPYHAPCKEMVLPMPTPAPRARAVVADAGKSAADGHKAGSKSKVVAHSKPADARGKPAAAQAKAAPSAAHDKIQIAQKSVAKVEKSKGLSRPRQKAPTQQLAARKGGGDSQKPTKVAQR